MRERLAAFGRTLIIANPEAQLGAGRKVAERLQHFLSLAWGDGGAFDLVLTERPRHAAELAADTRGYGTVVALGGDGVIHEVVNGLMRHDPASRPALAVVPVGSGNDYALTLGISDFSGDELSALLSYRPRRMDVGCAELAGPNGGRCEYFTETLSVGLDAQIAIGTYELRKRTGLTGGALYTASGLQVFGTGYRSFPMEAAFDDGPARPLDAYLMAIQIGPTYGSGFRVCPDADPSDGLLDICWAKAPAPRAVTLPVFLRAKGGRHVSSRIIEMRRAASVELALAGDGYPIQLDGEQARASHVRASVVPGALTVLAPDA